METSTAYCMEDKKCRICGLADIYNINIFTSASSKALIRKILAVYPIVIYQHDPLPKNICKKCINNVNFMYTDIQRVIKTQEKWTDNVRRVQPNNDYVRIMDLVEDSYKLTINSIKTTFHVDIQRIPGQMISKDSTQNNNISAEDPSTIINNTRLEVNGPAFQEIQKTLGIHKVKSVTNSTTEIKELKTMLALNGCTLRPVNVSKSKSEAVQNILDINTNDARETTDSESGHSEDDIPLAYCSPPSSQRKVTQSVKSVKCRYCELRFESQSCLATHQTQHMRLSIPRLCDKKYLEKKLRKGRVITVQDHKRIRCLNCWHLFVNNKAILNHWIWGECDFYCHICGEEFPTSPKLLRDHVPTEHGISYRSSKIGHTPIKTQKVVEPICDYRSYEKVYNVEPFPQQDKVNRCATTKRNDSTKEQQNCGMVEPAITSTHMSTTIKKLKRQYPLDRFNSAKCNICHRTFNNFKACNSHMRKHKPSYIYGDIVLSPHAYGDGYNNIDPQVQEAQTGNHIDNINGKRNNWPTAHERSTTNFVTRQVDMKTSTGIRIRSITEMQKSAQPQRTVHPNVITAEATNSLSYWLAASNGATFATANRQMFESKVKEEPKDFDNI